jgi:hypothetical protein
MAWLLAEAGLTRATVGQTQWGIGERTWGAGEGETTSRLIGVYGEPVPLRSQHNDTGAVRRLHWLATRNTRHWAEAGPAGASGRTLKWAL